MEKTITIMLPAMQFKVEGKDEKDLLENAKKAMVEQLSKQFPKITYSVSDADVLSEEEAIPGTIIQDTDGKIGIISSRKLKNKRPINITFKNCIDVSAVPEVLKLSDATFEEARSKRPDYRKDSWNEGETGYVKTKDGIEAVIVGAKKGKKRELWAINGKGKGFIVSEEQLLVVLKDEKSEIK